MKILLPVLFFIPLFFVSCEVPRNFNGAWALKETYDYWKNGRSEEIISTVSRIDNIEYLVLTNSIVINTKEHPGVFYVPGGRWEVLDIKKANNGIYIMNLQSIRNKNAQASLYIYEYSESQIYFEVKSMMPEFKKEIDQSFLLLGDNFPYILCDKKQ